MWSDILFYKTGFAYQSAPYKLSSEGFLSQLSFETKILKARLLSKAGEYPLPVRLGRIGVCP